VHNTSKALAWIGSAMFGAFAAGAPIGTALYGRYGFGAIALATILLATAMIVVAAGYGIYRILTRGDTTDRSMGAFAGES